MCAAAGWYHTVRVMEDGSVKAFGDNRQGQCNIPGLDIERCPQKAQEIAADADFATLTVIMPRLV